MNSEPPLLTTYNLEDMLSSLKLPSPADQALNIIRFVGDHVMSTGTRLENPARHFHTVVGSPNREFALRLVSQLAERRLISIANPNYLNTVGEPHGVDLTLEGWERYEAEKRGQAAGSYGFMALKFNDPELDAFQRKTIKPAVASIGYTLEDMRDAARAGVIDNVMRARIRDAAFVVVDLTHDNAGAYWEAGYAEGLGKPVLYICKRDIFESRGTHFDTNHCTTVTWDAEHPEEFSANFVATLRRSLGLFNS